MATHVRTVEYAFSTRTTVLACATSLASSTRHDFSAITISLPETASPRVFKSVTAMVTYHHANGSAWNIVLGQRMGIKLGSVAFDDLDSTVGSSNLSAWDTTELMTRDVTSYFTANFGSSATQTCQIGFALAYDPGRGSGQVNNITAKLIITYEYDDSSSSKCKTVRIPLDGNKAALATSLTQLGTNQVPDLDDFLPESNKSYKKIWFEIEGNEANSGTDHAVEFALDSESGVATGTIFGGGGRACQLTYYWVRDDMSTSVAHAFKARATTSNRFFSLKIVLCVTYTFDDPTSSMIVSRKIPVQIAPGPLAGLTDDRLITSIRFDIPEANPTLLQSGLELYFTTSDQGGPSITCGTQSSARDYTQNGTTSYAGGCSLSHRIDSGAEYSSGIDIDRGRNTLYVKTRCSAASDAYGLTGFLILNYTCDVPGLGESVASHSTAWMRYPTMTGGIEGGVVQKTIATSSGVDPDLPSKWARTADVGYALWAYSLVAIDGASINPYLWVESVPVSDSPSEWIQVGSGLYSYWDFNAGGQWSLYSSPQFTRWAGDDVTGLVDTSSSHRTRIFYPRFRPGLMQWIDYHAQTHTVAATYNTDSGDGSGVTVSVHRVDNGEQVATTTTTLGGAFSAKVYDASVQYFAEAWQDATHLGRSDIGYPVEDVV